MRVARTSPSVALPCPGIGRVRRGFESFLLDLAQALEGEVDLTLYGCGEVAEHRVVRLPSLFREQPLLQRALPGHAYRRYQLEQMTFFLPLMWQLLRHPVDLIHVSDQFLAKLLQKTRSRIGAHYRIVFSNGAPSPAEYLHQFDFSQAVTPLQYQEALRSGLPKERIAMVPYGLSCAEFESRARGMRASTRDRLGIPEASFVVLCVAPLDFGKRSDYLINEIGKVPMDDLVLVLAGQASVGTPELRTLVERALPGRHRILTATYQEMPGLYAASDVFALSSILEGFGRVVLEAMAVGLPALVDDNPHYEWIVPDARNRVHMDAPGALAERTLELYRDRDLVREIGASNKRDVFARFDWGSLRPAYVQMYQDAMKVRI